jgi:hypothetical protein
MRTTQNVMSFAVAINQRVYEVEIDQTWEHDSTPLDRYTMTIEEGGDSVIDYTGYVTLRGAYVAALDTIVNTEEARHEPAV